MVRVPTAVVSAAVAIVALAAAGCGDGGSASSTDTTAAPEPTTTAAPPPPASTTSATTTAAAPPTTSTTCTAPAAADTTSRRGGAPSETMFLTAVSAAGHGCVDRIEFTFRADRVEEPGYTVEYRPRAAALIEDGSGRRLREEGSAFLVVRLEPAATADSSSGDLVFTYNGPRRIRPTGAAHVRELLKTGDFEAVVTWAIGLDGTRPFSVSTSGTPPRVVVEIG